MLDKLPGMGNMAQMAQQQVDVKQFARMEAMINSMTAAERRRPEIIQGSRKRRITRGSGTQVPDLNRLLVGAGGVLSCGYTTSMSCALSSRTCCLSVLLFNW